jgi:hypothetical protein
MKTIDELERLPTKRLLSYFKSERKRFLCAGFTCDCCNEFWWNISDKYKNMKIQYEDWTTRLNSIKSLLNKREHIKKKHSNIPRG